MAGFRVRGQHGEVVGGTVALTKRVFFHYSKLPSAACGGWLQPSRFHPPFQVRLSAGQPIYEPICPFEKKHDKIHYTEDMKFAIL